VLTFAALSRLMPPLGAFIVQNLVSFVASIRYQLLVFFYLLFTPRSYFNASVGSRGIVISTVKCNFMINMTPFRF